MNRFVDKPWVDTPAFEALANAATMIRFGADCDTDRMMADLRRSTAWAIQALGLRTGNSQDVRRFDEAMNERARRLCAMLYDDYLQTDHWKLVRSLALRRARHRCAVCPRTYSLQVHHVVYDTRGEEIPEDLTVLCDEHHQLFHFHQRHRGGLTA